MMASGAAALRDATSLVLLADDNSTSEATKAGPIAVVVIVVLIVASFFLFKSMSKQLRKVRDNYPVQGEDGPIAGNGAGRAPASNPAVGTTSSANPPGTVRPRTTATSKSRASVDDRRLTRRPDAGGPDRT